jgi:hypothetical protein
VAENVVKRNPVVGKRCREMNLVTQTGLGRVRSALVIVAVAGLSLSACSSGSGGAGGDPSAPAVTSTAPTTNPTPSSTATLAQGLPKQLSDELYTLSVDIARENATLAQLSAPNATASTALKSMRVQATRARKGAYTMKPRSCSTVLAARSATAGLTATIAKQISKLHSLVKKGKGQASALTKASDVVTARAGKPDVDGANANAAKAAATSGRAQASADLGQLKQIGEIIAMYVTQSAHLSFQVDKIATKAC